MLCTGVPADALGAAGAGGGGGRLTTGGRAAGAACGCFHVGGGAGAAEGAALAALGPPKVFRRFATEKGTFPLTAGSSARLLMDIDFIPLESDCKLGLRTSLAEGAGGGGAARLATDVRLGMAAAGGGGGARFIAGATLGSIGGGGGAGAAGALLTGSSSVFSKSRVSRNKNGHRLLAPDTDRSLGIPPANSGPASLGAALDDAAADAAGPPADLPPPDDFASPTTPPVTDGADLSLVTALFSFLPFWIDASSDESILNMCLCYGSVARVCGLEKKMCK